MTVPPLGACGASVAGGAVGAAVALVVGAVVSTGRATVTPATDDATVVTARLVVGAGVTTTGTVVLVAVLVVLVVRIVEVDVLDVVEAPTAVAVETTGAEVEGPGAGASLFSHAIREPANARRISSRRIGRS